MTLTAGVDRGLAIVGGRGAGKSSAVRLCAVQHRDAVVIGPDAEQAWDTLTALVTGHPGALVLCDDLDLLLSGYPHEYAREFLDMFERLARGGGGPRRTVVITASRLSGGAQRLIEALPQRALLHLGSRAEHAAAGGDAEGFRVDREPGRARLGAHDVQFAWVDERRSVTPRTTGRRALSGGEEHWEPGHEACALLVSHPSSVAAALREDHPAVSVVSVEQAAERPDLLSIAGDTAVVIGDGAQWQRYGGVWQRMRGSGRILVQAECASELRVVAGVRGLPPYAAPHAGRAWVLHEAQPLRRVHVPVLDPRRARAPVPSAVDDRVPAIRALRTAPGAEFHERSRLRR